MTPYLSERKSVKKVFTKPDEMSHDIRQPNTTKCSSKSAILSCSEEVETADFLGPSSHLAIHSKNNCNKPQKVMSTY